MPVATTKKIIPVTLTPGEIAEMEEDVKRGDLPPDAIDQYFKALEDNVFGFDHRKDRHGEPIEQGVGSPGNQTRNSVEAFRKYGKGEPGYEDTLKRLEAELKESDARRAAARAKAKPRRKVAA